jgi:hypothetical protein
LRTRIGSKGRTCRINKEYFIRDETANRIRRKPIIFPRNLKDLSDPPTVMMLGQNYHQRAVHRRRELHLEFPVCKRWPMADHLFARILAQVPNDPVETSMRLGIPKNDIYWAFFHLRKERSTKSVVVFVQR